MSADDDGGAAFWQAVSARETDWWATHAASVGALEELQKLGMQPENCWFAGELLFLRRGLKPCVVLSNLSVAASASFAQHVLGDAPAEAAGGSPGHPPLLARDRYRSFRLPAGLNTEIYDFSQQLIIVDTHSVVATDDDATPGSLVRQLLALESIGATALKADSSVYLTERFWATAFDYPVSLDDMAPDEADAELGLIEIGYRGGEAGRLLTFYGAAQRSELMARVMAHYQRYRAACESSGVRLQIEIKEVDEIDYGLDDFGFEEADFLDDDQEGR